MLSLLGLQLSGISDLCISLDNSLELIELEDNDKEEKDENEEDVKLHSSNLASFHLSNAQWSKLSNRFIQPSGYSLVTDTPPPESIS